MTRNALTANAHRQINGVHFFINALNEGHIWTNKNTLLNCWGWLPVSADAIVQAQNFFGTV